LESFLERYTIISGETFNISVSNEFEPRSDETSSGLSFRVEPTKDPGTSWTYVIRISWPTKIGWGIKQGELHPALTKLGLLKIKQALEAGNREGFAFTFRDGNTGKTLEDTLAMEEEELERIRKRVADGKESTEVELIPNRR
jgi:hypothetical protein